jgi:hypothetical protein
MVITGSKLQNVTVDRGAMLEALSQRAAVTLALQASAFVAIRSASGHGCLVRRYRTGLHYAVNDDNMHS